MYNENYILDLIYANNGAKIVNLPLAVIEIRFLLNIKL